MSELPSIISAAFANEYRCRAAELHKWADPLTDAQFWRNPYTYGNSVGHLVVHLTGNLSYDIGARIIGYGIHPHPGSRIRRRYSAPQSRGLAEIRRHHRYRCRHCRATIRIRLGFALFG